MSNASPISHSELELSQTEVAPPSAAAMLFWGRAKAWSLAADQLKAAVTQVRTAALFMASICAILETLVATAPGLPAQVRLIIAIIGAAGLAALPVLRGFYLTPERLRAWTRARSASEGIKSEVFTFRAGAAPYDGEDASERLMAECRKIEENVSDLRHLANDVPDVKETDVDALKGERYIEHRLQQQISSYYRPKSRQAAKSAAKYRRLEVALATLAAVVAAAFAVLQGYKAGGDPPTFGAWASVITTITGALATHAAANRFDFLATSYAATASRLEELLTTWRNSRNKASEQWSSFVSECEKAISIENESWLSKWTESESKD